MNTQLALILPSLVLPLSLPAGAFFLSRRWPGAVRFLPLLWLPSCFWLLGWPEVFPLELQTWEAQDWLWPLLLMSLAIQLALREGTRIAGAAQGLLLGLALLTISAPVWRYQPSPDLVLELVVLWLAGSAMIHAAQVQRAATPALVVCVAGGGLAMVTALGGSVLIGQMAGALASLLALFAVNELREQPAEDRPKALPLTPLLQVLLVLLGTARLYAQIPLISAGLLLVALGLGLGCRYRLAALGGVIGAATALAWLLATSDSSSYY